MIFMVLFTDGIIALVIKNTVLAINRLVLIMQSSLWHTTTEILDQFQAIHCLMYAFKSSLYYMSRVGVWNGCLHGLRNVSMEKNIPSV